MSKDDTDGKRRATRKEIVTLMKSLKIEQDSDECSNEWLAVLGARLKEHYPGTYEGVMKLAREKP